MDCKATRIPYSQAGVFSKIVNDYVDQAGAIKPFFAHPPSLNGIKEAIEARKNFSTNREVLVAALKAQYSDLLQGNVASNINALLSPGTFTVTTAHQPNIF